MKKLLLTLALLIALSASASAVSVSDFVDVKQGDWFYTAVDYALQHEMTTGKSATEFVPHSSMGRAEYITMISRLNGSPFYDRTPNATPYEDNVMRQWYTPHINWAWHFGITTEQPGETATNFRVDDAITREEMAIFLGKYIDVLDINLPLSTDAPAQFGDAADVSAYAAPYVETCRKYGLIIGNTYGDFVPKSQLTRAECFTIGMRVHQILAAHGSDIDRPIYVTPFAWQIAEVNLIYNEQGEATGTAGIKVGETYQMEIEYWLPENTTTKELVWSIPESFSEFASITEDGLITGLKEGIITVWTTHPDGQVRMSSAFIAPA